MNEAQQIKGEQMDGAEACRILVVKLSSLGDVLHALPAVSVLRERLGAEVDWCVQQEYADLVSCFDDVSRVIPFPRRSFFRDRRRFSKDLKQVRYDYVIDMQGLLKSAVVTLMAKGKRKIGPSFAREGSALLYRERAKGHGRNRHAVQRNMDIVRHLKLSPFDVRFPITFPEIQLERGRPRIAIVPRSRWQTKTWEAGRFVEMARSMLNTGPMSFYVVGGASDQELCQSVADKIGNCAENTAGKYSIPESGGLLKQMDLVVSNDSGPMHIAAALEVPVLALFGPTSAVRTGPYGDQHRVLTADVECGPCFSRKCRNGDIACLNNITPETAATAALEMLGSRREVGP